MRIMSFCMLIQSDLQRRVLEPNQTRHQERKAEICSKLFPTQRLSMELWCIPKSEIFRLEIDQY